MHAKVLATAIVTLVTLCWPLRPAQGATPPAAAASQAKQALPPDHSGKTRRGRASFYSHRLSGRTMADGSPMDPGADTAASKTLPLGTTARVTNLHNGRSIVVVVRDRGPYVKGRIVDLSPHAARAIGLGRSGVTPVEVAPIAVPQPDGSMKPGDGALDGGTPAPRDACPREPISCPGKRSPPH